MNLALSWRWGLNPPPRGNQQILLLCSVFAGVCGLETGCEKMYGDGGLEGHVDIETR